MGVISIETKKVPELVKITSPASGNIIPIHDGTGLKGITLSEFSQQSE